MLKAILESLYSRRDRNGNCYWALRYTDCASAIRVEGTVSGGESNIKAILPYLGLEWKDVHYGIHDFGYREFRQVTKSFEYAGCCPDELAHYIRTKLGEPDSRRYSVPFSAVFREIPYDSDKIREIVKANGGKNIRTVEQKPLYSSNDPRTAQVVHFTAPWQTAKKVQRALESFHRYVHVRDVKTKQDLG